MRYIEQNKSFIWALGFLIMTIVIDILALAKVLLQAIGIFAAAYMFVFVIFMTWQTIKSKDALNHAYEEISGITVLDSRTVVDEEKFEASTFYVADITDFPDLSEDDSTIIKNYKPSLTADLEKAISPNINKKDAKKTIETLINDITNWNIVKCQLIRQDYISGYSSQGFERFYILTPTTGLTACKFNYNVPVFWEGYNLTGTIAFADLLFITWILPDTPLFMIYNSPQLVLPLTNVRKELQGIANKTDLIYKHEILDLIEKQTNFDMKIQEKDKQIELLALSATNAELRAEFIQTKELEQPARDIDPNYTYTSKTGFGISLAMNFLLGAFALSQIIGGLLK